MKMMDSSNNDAVIVMKTRRFASEKWLLVMFYVFFLCVKVMIKG